MHTTSVQAGFEKINEQDMNAISHTAGRLMRKSSESRYNVLQPWFNNLLQLNIGDYIRRVLAEISRTISSNEMITVELDIEDLYLGVNEIIPIGLIIKEAVTNSYNHAFTDTTKGRITISFRKDPRCGYTLAISDDGIGFPGSLDITGHVTGGMGLIKELTGWIGGTATLCSGTGTTVAVCFGK